MATFTLTTGTDTVTGTGNADKISATAAALTAGDKIDGKGGNDTLQLIGGGTFDLTVLASLLSVETITLDKAGSTLQLRDGMNVTVNAAGGNDTILDANGNDTVNAGAGSDSVSGGGGNDKLSGQADNDTLIGGDGLDTLDGGGGSDSLFGDMGNDKLTGGAGNDTLDGGADNDNILGEGGNDSLIGGGGADQLDGGTDNDNLSGGLADDVLRGAGGNDSLDGGADHDSLFGGAGLDLLHGGAGNDTLDGGTGIDTATYASVVLALNIDLSLGAASGDGFDTLNKIENVIGGLADDTITGANLVNNLLDGGDGDDNLAGVGGNDTLVGGAGGDVLDGGAGDDSLLGGDDFDTFYGGAGNDTLDVGTPGQYDNVGYWADPSGIIVNLSGAMVSGVASETAKDGFGDIDTLINVLNVSGSEFADLIVGGAANEIIAGNGGNDTLVGGDGADGLEYSGSAGGVTVDLNIQDGTTAQFISAGEGSDILSGFDDIGGSFFDDTFVGNASNNDFDGRGGNDTIDGGAGSDDVFFSGVIADYQITSNSGLITVIDLNLADGDDGTDTLVNVEELLFADQNVRAPTITSDGGGATAAIQVAENNTAVTTVTAADPDVGDAVTFSIAGGFDGNLFTIDSQTGALSFITAPDFENPNLNGGGFDQFYDVLVRATDSQDLFDEQLITVTVTDGNEAPAITSDGGGATAAIQVAENNAAVSKVTAADPDIGDAVTFSIAGGFDGNLFTIDSQTGALSFITAPDYENPNLNGGGFDQFYDVLVRATDSQGLFDDQLITVTVTDANDAPAITSDGSGESASILMAENNTAVTTVTAIDPDAGDTLTFSIAGGFDGNLFTIDSQTGALSFISVPDFENPDINGGGVDQFYDVLVRATDGQGLFDEQLITVTVTDVNEAPAITSDGGGATAAIQVAENNAAVTTVAATDPDAGDGATFSIAGGFDGNLFTIDSQTGALSFITAPDFENPNLNGGGFDQFYDVVVRATDSQGLFDDQLVTVTVTNVNDVPVAADASAAGAEDAASIAVTLTGSDVDGTIQSIMLTSLPQNGTLYADAGLTTLAAINAPYVGSSLTFYFMPDADFSGPASFQYTVTDDQGAVDVTPATATIDVTPVADPPAVTVADARGDEDTAIPLDVSAALSDTDGSETLTLVVSTIPVGAILSDGVNSFTATAGSTSVDIVGWMLSALVITPPANSDVDFQLTVTATATETADGSVASNSATLNITVNAVADAPVLAVADASGDEDSAIPFDLSAALADADGSESLALTVSGIPVGATLSDSVNSFTAAGTTTSVDISGWNQSALTITPPANSDADFQLAVTTRATENNTSLDVFFTNSGSGGMVVWLNDGTGAFSQGSIPATPAAGNGVELGDLDGDGDVDAFVGSAGGSRVWLNDGAGGLVDSAQSLASGDTNDVALGDIDGDGDVDAMTANFAGASRIWMNNGDGQFVLGGSPLGAAEEVELADLDGDGDLDAVVTHFNTSSRVWLNDGSGTLTSAAAIAGSGSVGVSLGDLDGDGDADAVVSNAFTDGASAVYLNDGNGTFGAAVENFPARSYRNALGDVDGDGDQDILLGGWFDGGTGLGAPTTVWLNDGAGNFTSSGQSFGPGGTLGVALGDVDNDGDLDALLGNTGAAAPNEVWLNDGSGQFTQGVTLDPPAAPWNVALGDLGGNAGEQTTATINVTVNTGNVAPTITSNGRQIDIAGSGNNTLTLSVLDVLDLSDESNALLVDGDAGDAVNTGPERTMATADGSNGKGTSTIGGETYQIYPAGQATLSMDTDISTIVS
jgi:Ca2+-binding RTX toxin-like protein